MTLRIELSEEEKLLDFSPSIASLQDSTFIYFRHILHLSVGGKMKNILIRFAKLSRAKNTFLCGGIVL